MDYYNCVNYSFTEVPSMTFCITLLWYETDTLPGTEMSLSLHVTDLALSNWNRFSKPQASKPQPPPSALNEFSGTGMVHIPPPPDWLWNLPISPTYQDFNDWKVLKDHQSQVNFRKYKTVFQTPHFLNSSLFNWIGFKDLGAGISHISQHRRLLGFLKFE